MSNTLSFNNMGLSNISDMFRWADEALSHAYDDDWISAWRTGAPSRATGKSNSIFQESEDSYSLYVPLTGLGKEDINVSVLDGVIKLTANPLTVKGMGEHIDCDVSKILSREMNLSEAGDELIKQTVRVANGRLTCAEALGHKEFVMTKLYRSA